MQKINEKEKEKRIEQLLKAMVDYNEYEKWYDAYDESFKHEFITDENGYIWYEDGNFHETLVIDINTGVAMIFENLEKRKWKWRFKEIDVKLTKILSKKWKTF